MNALFYKTMSTFEKVRTRITRDMDAHKFHTPESWANILLTNTALLKDEKEQGKFWKWLQNPEDEDHIEPPTLARCGEPVLSPEFVTTTVQDECDEKEGETIVELQNQFQRNGFVMTCRTKPVN